MTLDRGEAASFKMGPGGAVRDLGGVATGNCKNITWKSVHFGRLMAVL